MIGFVSQARAQSNNIKYLSSFQSALGSNTSIIGGVHGVLGNPGSIADINTPLAFMVNTEQRFFLGSLNSTSFSGIVNIGTYDYLAFSLGSFGIEEYQEKRVSVAYSRKINENVFIGSTANFYQKSIEEYSSEKDFDINLGIKALIFKNMEFGVAAYNILQNANKGYLRQNTDLSIGIDYHLSKKVNWLIEFRSNLSNYVTFSTGISYQIIDQLNLQIGMNTMDNGISMGLSYNLNSQWKIDASSRSNQNLGISPGMSVIYQK